MTKPANHCIKILPDYDPLTYDTDTYSDDLGGDDNADEPTLVRKDIWKDAEEEDTDGVLGKRESGLGLARAYAGVARGGRRLGSEPDERVINDGEDDEEDADDEDEDDDIDPDQVSVEASEDASEPDFDRDSDGDSDGSNYVPKKLKVKASSHIVKLKMPAGWKPLDGEEEADEDEGEGDLQVKQEPRESPEEY
ncbi:hypothetical protein LTR17_003188 [Elasticomyces elasticus]|nr:hypothetical protein LTR17_003188 [Elasticomyces elasticus]